MSYCRFGWHKSDVYVFLNEKQKYECCACSLLNNQPFFCNTPKEMKAHLLEHKKRGHIVPHYAIDRLDEEINKHKRRNKTKND